MKSRPQRAALVTGSAARIGASIAGALHARGLDVLVHCNANVAGASALAKRLNRVRPDSAHVVSADLAREAGVESLVAACREWTDRLDVLVNNASRFYPTAAGATHGFEWDDLIDSNLRGAYFLTQGLLPLLRAAQGAIVNILDVHAERPMAGHAVYCIAKAGLRMMTLALARELGPEVRVNGVAPGAILWPEPEPGEEAKRAILARTALGRIGSPEDIATAVSYLALDAPYVTGQILAVDGGRLLTI